MRLVLFFLILFLSQGLLSALPAPLPAPDLFLLAMLVLMGRFQAWQLVLLGYAIGLLQDIVGHGVLGLHAFGLAAAALAAAFAQRQISQRGIFARSLIVTVALCGKWLAIAPLLVWQTGSLVVLLSALQVAPIELVFTLLLSFFILPWGEKLMERTLLLREDAL